jgi:uncharacterized protein
MAKAPQAGRAKTRLSPPLTPAQAAKLGAAFLRDITENICVAGEAMSLAGFVAYAPEGAEPLFDGLLAPDTGLVLADGSITVPHGVEGFGRSLLHAATSLFDQGYGAVCLVNADSPTLPTEFLHDAAATLARPGDRVVLGVAEDGGYYLIGMKSPHAALFQEITWSTDMVSAQTLERAASLGLDSVRLPVWFDVDDAASLARLVADLAAVGQQASRPQPFAAPATRALVQHFDLAERLGVVAPSVR